MLDELTVPFDCKDPDLEKTEVTVGLTVTGPVPWEPTVPNKNWNTSERKLTEVGNASLVHRPFDEITINSFS